MSRAQDGRTLIENVYAKVRSAILSGRLQPGQRIKLAALCTDYGVSLSVVREALARLADRGLINSSPRRGFAVTSLSARDLDDLTSVRVDVESLSLRYAIERGDVTWEAKIVAAHHTLERTLYIDADDQIREKWMDAHAAFHRAILEGCNSRRLSDFANSLRDSSELYQYWSRTLGNDKARDVSSEHEALLRATLDRDIDRATAILRQHISHTSDALASGVDFESIGRPRTAGRADSTSTTKSSATNS